MNRLFVASSLAMLLVAATACEAGSSPIQAEFQARGFDYPIHVISEPPAIPKLVNPGAFGDRSAPELQDLFNSAWRAFLAEPHDKFVQAHCPEAEAFVLDDPILLEDAGQISFGVTLTCYGQGAPPLHAKWQGDRYWTVSNIALFGNEGGVWKMRGWLF